MGGRIPILRREGKRGENGRSQSPAPGGGGRGVGGMPSL